MSRAPSRPDPDAVRAMTARLDEAAQVRLGRSLALFHAPTGGCNGCELELRLLDGVAYALARLGLQFVTVPAQADVLLATGPLCRSMAGALGRAWTAMTRPKWAVAVGDCAIDGGVFAGSYAVLNGIAAAVPVDLVVRGCPPSPEDVLRGLMLLVAANGPVDKHGRPE